MKPNTNEALSAARILTLKSGRAIVACGAVVFTVRVALLLAGAERVSGVFGFKEQVRGRLGVPDPVNATVHASVTVRPKCGAGASVRPVFPDPPADAIVIDAGFGVTVNAVNATSRTR